VADVIFGPTKRGDRKTAILVDLQRGDGTYPDLTGLLTSAIRFHFKDLKTGAVTQGNASAIVSLTNPAQVRYDPTAADVLNVVEYEVEVQVTHLDGLPETFPSCDRFLWPIVPDIA
jgi:hypothetical protein